MLVVVATPMLASKPLTEFFIRDKKLTEQRELNAAPSPLVSPRTKAKQVREDDLPVMESVENPLFSPGRVRAAAKEDSSATKVPDLDTHGEKSFDPSLLSIASSGEYLAMLKANQSNPITVRESQERESMSSGEFLAMLSANQTNPIMVRESMKRESMTRESMTSKSMTSESSKRDSNQAESPSPTFGKHDQSNDPTANRVQSDPRVIPEVLEV
jgi:hypothetical protein